ncbi:hypothetical protein Ddc_22507 [Ditylenchus destructor]|nr:hypothetical protein Ddc_22507 [Ditylenchus destructor]
MRDRTTGWGRMLLLFQRRIAQGRGGWESLGRGHATNVSFRLMRCTRTGKLCGRGQGRGSWRPERRSALAQRLANAARRHRVVLHQRDIGHQAVPAAQVLDPRQQIGRDRLPADPLLIGLRQGLRNKPVNALLRHREPPPAPDADHRAAPRAPASTSSSGTPRLFHRAIDPEVRLQTRCPAYRKGGSSPAPPTAPAPHAFPGTPASTPDPGCSWPPRTPPRPASSPASCKSAERSKDVSAPRCTPPIPPVTKTPDPRQLRADHGRGHGRGAHPPPSPARKADPAGSKFIASGDRPSSSSFSLFRPMRIFPSSTAIVAGTAPCSRTMASTSPAVCTFSDTHAVGNDGRLQRHQRLALGARGGPPRARNRSARAPPGIADGSRR